MYLFCRIACIALRHYHPINCISVDNYYINLICSPDPEVTPDAGLAVQRPGRVRRGLHAELPAAENLHAAEVQLRREFETADILKCNTLYDWLKK